jgi:hypothetical protein
MFGGGAHFRRGQADTGTLMVVMMGEREVSIPLASLRREFGLEAGSDDSAMLDLIEKALDFVSTVQPGDVLPEEVLSGGASWIPDERHRRIAANRLRLQLVAWLRGVEPALSDTGALLRIDNDPELGKAVQAALDRAACVLGLADAGAVLALMEEMAGELAYIEALREWLFEQVQAMAVKVAGLAHGFKGDVSHQETLTQVRRLTGIALRQFALRFEQIDAQTGEVLATLRNAERQRGFVRGHRDWLFSSWRAWSGILAAWKQAAPKHDNPTWALLNLSYQFLAPRFMPVTEWVSKGRPARQGREAAQMVW